MIIQLPFVPTKREQVDAVVAILKKEMPSYHQPGVQIFRGPVDLYQQAGDSELADYLNRTVPQGFVKTLHAPISDNDPDRRFNLAYQESEGEVLRNLRLAEQIGARSLTIHMNTVYRQEGEDEFLWIKELNDYETMQRRIRQPAFARLNKLAARTGLLIGVENMPLPIRGDKIKDPEKIKYEPNMNTYEDLLEFCEIMPANVGITYDTSHAEITRRVLNRLRNMGVRTAPDLQLTHYRGVYPEHFGGQPGVKEALLSLLERGKVVDVQFADVTGQWEPGKSLVKEGVPLGEGFLGGDIFEIARTISRYHADVPVSLDVAEEGEQAYVSRLNQRRSLTRLLKELG